jgi:hypothetical protein
MILTAHHFRGHDSLCLAVFNGIVLWGATDQTGAGYRVLLAFESDIRSGHLLLLDIGHRPEISFLDSQQNIFDGQRRAIVCGHKK